MIGIDKINAYLLETLSEKRYKHSLGVAQEAVKLSDHYGADREKAYLAGLVHDCAKEIAPQEMLSLIKDKYGVSPDSISLHRPKLLHGILGAAISQNRFGIYDTAVLDAIRYHTTGKANMSLLSKIIYIADYIEPNRDYEDVDYLRKLAYEDIDKAIIYGIDFTIRDLLDRGATIHPDTMHCRNDLLIKKAERSSHED
ncbi:MAG: bis(5'-nucleosyl)-tetraphosphatase (symmetrical) YqeK [Clostridia bacterium]|nr:bis(5'-nucleosyl)-tetraphosphatase (symmetrical) YqeK [Clostridia bacterium]